MSTFEREGYEWRETYFILFDNAKRPSLKRMEKLLRGLNRRFELTSQTADDDGHFESITILSPEDYAALDISFESGDDVREQTTSLYQELKPSAIASEDRAKLARIRQLNGRFDLMHFEQVGSNVAADDEPEMLDPSALLLVLDALIEETEGVGVDPQSGTFL